MFKWVKEHKIEILMGLITILVILLTITFSDGWNCLLNNENCPPISNATGKINYYGFL